MSASGFAPPTWIDDVRVLWAVDGISTGRWVIYDTECERAFSAMHESSSGDSMGGEDSVDPAGALASGIDRWSAPSVGVVASATFFDVLRRDAELAEFEAEAAGVKAVRCRDLYNNMCARAETAEAEATLRGWSKPDLPSIGLGA